MSFDKRPVKQKPRDKKKYRYPRVSVREQFTEASVDPVTGLEAGVVK